MGAAGHYIDAFCQRVLKSAVQTQSVGHIVHQYRLGVHVFGLIVDIFHRFFVNKHAFPENNQFRFGLFNQCPEF